MQSIIDLVKSAQTTDSVERKHQPGKFRIQEDLYRNNFKLVAEVFRQLEYVPWSISRAGDELFLTGYSPMFEKANPLINEYTIHVSEDSNRNLIVEAKKL